MSAEAALAAAVVLPLGAAALIALLDRWPNVREAVSVAAGVALFAAAVFVARAQFAGEAVAVELAPLLPRIPLALRAEPLGVVFALVASGLWIVTTVYSIGYMRANREGHQTRFYACFAIALASTMGVAFAGNMLTLFVFYEALTLSTYPLVTHHGTEEAKRAGRVYLGILLGTSIALQLMAIVWTWFAAGTLDFAPGGILAGHVEGGMAAILLALYVFGIGKAALMPFHRWLPAAMVAPTPVSALLHAVAVVKAGVFTVVKVIVYVFGLDLLAAGPGAWLPYAAGFTILAASLIALRQDNLKLRLAYSTVSQLSYVVLGAAVLAPLSVMGAVLHIAAHAFGKITLFFAAGSIYTAAHKTKISDLDGIGRRMPWTMGAFAVGALSMIGLPPTAGFLSKWFMLSGAMATGAWVAVGVIVLSTLLNAAYFLPIVHRAFFRAPAASEVHAGPGGHGHGHAHDHGEAPLPVVAALTLTAAATLALFFWPDLFLALAHAVVAP